MYALKLIIFDSGRPDQHSSSVVRIFGCRSFYLCMLFVIYKYFIRCCVLCQYGNINWSSDNYWERGKNIKVARESGKCFLVVIFEGVETV